MTEPLRLAGVSEEEAMSALDGLRGDYRQIARLHRVIEVAYLLLSQPGVLEATGLYASKGDAPAAPPGCTRGGAGTGA